MICKNLCILLRVSTIAVCKHKHYSATCKFRCGQWGLKIALERQIRIGSSVNTEPVCFSDWVTWPKTDRQTDRQTRQADAREDEGDRHVVPEWLIWSVVFQPTAAHWRTLSPWRVQTHKQIEMSPTPTLFTHAMSSSVSFGFSPRLSVCLSLFTSSCLSVDLTPISLSPPHSLLLQLVIHPSLLNVLLCLTKRRRQTSWSCDMNTFSHQIPSRLNIIRWLIDHLSVLFFNCQYKVFFPPLRVSFRDRAMTWNPAWGYGTVLFSSNESGQISAALLDCLPEFSQCQFLDFFSAYSLSSVCYQHLALQLSKGNEMVTQCSAYS